MQFLFLRGELLFTVVLLLVTLLPLGPFTVVLLLVTLLPLGPFTVVLLLVTL